MESHTTFTNPYSELALLHNEGLNYVAKKLSPKQVTIEQVLKATADYMQNVTGKHRKVDFAFHYQEVSKAINSSEQISFIDFMKGVNVSKKAACFIEEIEHVPLDLDLQITTKILGSIEENILVSDLPEDDKFFPLLMTSVGSASSKYWLEQLSLEISVWSPFIEDGDISQRKWPWNKDYRGAMFGWVGGIITGNPFLGALGGAVGKSVASWLFGRK